MSVLTRVGPLAWAAAACVLLAVVSVLVLPSTPSYDPWAWIVWGREISSGAFTFATNGGPSWKPLPVLFTTVFGLFGGLAPKLWLIAARAGGLLALLGAYRLGWRLAGRVAGVLAALALLLTHESTGSPPIVQDWVHYLFRGASEPMLVACALWAIEAHVSGRRWLAFWLGVATSLIRPEAWPFLGLYVLWMWRAGLLRSPRSYLGISGGLALLPILWFGPPWISTRHPFAASTQAAHYNGQLGSHPLLEVLSRGAHLTMLPVLVFALVAVVLGWRERDQLTLWLAGGAIAWVALVAAMTVAAYPGLGRFMYPPAAVACVLAGAGVVRLASLVPGRSPLVHCAVVAACVAIAVPFAVGRVSHAWKEKGEADQAVSFTNQLSDAVGVVGGRDRIMPCPTSIAAVNHTMQTALAWILHVRLARVKTVLRAPGVDFVGPHVPTIDGAAAPIRLHGGHTVRSVGSSGIWRVYRVLSPAAAAAAAAGGAGGARGGGAASCVGARSSS